MSEKRHTVAVPSGSLRKESLNREPARAVEKPAPAAGVDRYVAWIGQYPATRR